MMLRELAVVLAGLGALSAFAQDAPALNICDFDGAGVPWRSKHSRQAIAAGERDGVATQVLRLEFDLSQAPHYDWFRAMVSEGIDVTPYRYLSFRIWGDGNGAKMTCMFMQTTEPTETNRHGEITASAQNHPVVLSFEGWKQLCIPLATFSNIATIADRVQQVNFSLTRPAGDPGRAAALMLDDLKLTTEPVGDIVQERVPYPPADIAIGSEEEFFGLLDLELPKLKGVKQAAGAGDWEAAKVAWGEYLQARTEPRWTWSRHDKTRLLQIYDDRSGGLASYAPRADRVVRREFNWLGVHKTLERDVQWLQGPVEWTHVLSRHGYWKDLGYAYWGTADDAYADDWVYMLKDWIADNPVPRILTNSRGKDGTVWRTLETGIRGDVWFDVMELFMDAPQFDAEAKYLMTRSLVEHARHLHRYTVAFRYGNWQVVECTGLAAIGIMLPEFKEAVQWRERAFDYLVRHMKRDVYPDGAHHELTPGYHGWVMERFLKASLIAKANGYEIPGLLDRHEKMFEFLMHVSKPDRRFLPLGDAGGGGSIAANMALGALLYDRPDMRFLAVDKASTGWVWLFGPDAIDRYERLDKEPPAFVSHVMPHAQYAMMRTGWGPQDKCILLDCAPWGGGHSHQDRLQVLVYAGRDLLIDPGIYSYDEPLSRTYFRGAAAHNILTIDGDKQPQSDPEVVAWATTGELDFASGQIEQEGLQHRRSVMFVKPDYWVVVDHVLGQGSHELTRQFHFPLVEVRSDQEQGWARTAFDSGPNIWLKNADTGRLEMRKGWIPTGGAQAQEAPVAAFVNNSSLPAVLCTVLVPFEDEKALPRVEVPGRDDDRVARVRITFPDGQVDEIAVGTSPEMLTLGEHSAEGLALCLRRGPRANSVSLVDGSSVRMRQDD